MRVVKSHIGHIDHIYLNIRKQDQEELKKAGANIVESLIFGVNNGECYTVMTDNDVPCLMFGLVPNGFDSAVVWALGADDILIDKRWFLIESKRWLKLFNSKYSILFNDVDADNKQAVRWLKWLGAEFKKEPIKKNGYDFMRFKFNV